jgi:uncharacterized protein YbjQ (UPF0145 family)
MSDIILTTRDLKQSYEVVDLVNTTVAGNTWKDHAKELGLQLDTGWLADYDVNVAFSVASAGLRKKAEMIGADAVVGCEFDVGFDNSGPYCVGFGTAVKFD